MNAIQVIAPQTGVAFELKKDDILTIIDPMGQQVSDLVVFNRHDLKEKISAGKTMDFEETILLTSGNFLWSNRSQIMMEIVMDTNGRNDILLAPCSQETFTIMYDNPDYHPSCLENLYTNLKSYGLTVDDIPTAFNVFMNVQFDKKGKLKVLPPNTIPGDMLRLVAKMDVLIGMTACSAEDSNGGSFKPIHYVITDADGLLNP